MRRGVRLSLRFLGFVLVAALAHSPAALAERAVPTIVDFPGSDETRVYGINEAGAAPRPAASTPRGRSWESTGTIKAPIAGVMDSC